MKRLSMEGSTDVFDIQNLNPMLLDLRSDLQSIRDYELVRESDAIDLTGRFLFPSEAGNVGLNLTSFSEICHAFTKVNAVLLSLTMLAIGCGVA